jgi:UDP-N-acetylglucosamine 4,6-dehydratase/5-epimerase
LFSDLDTRVDRLVRGKVVLITGGTGTIGAALVRRLLRYEPQGIRILDHNEERTFFIEMEYKGHANVRPLLGDIRDRSRMTRALQGVHIVFHTAALKHVELGEYNPFEVVNTNLTALQSLLEISLDVNVEHFVFTSSDKAVNPTNVMGGSKFIGERLVIAANGYRGPKKTRFSCTRFGNVLGSAGSVLPVFDRQIAAGGPLTVTEPSMTRFFMTLDESVELVLAALVGAYGGEVFVPKMAAVKLLDLAEIVVEQANPKQKIDIQYVGLRSGEKMYEELITDNELPRCVETEKLLIVMPYLKGIQMDANGRIFAAEAKDYPDDAKMADRLYSSHNAVPLKRPEVHAFLKQARAALGRKS